MTTLYQSSLTYRNQLGGGPTAPKRISGLRDSGAAYACADSFGGGDYIVSLYTGREAIRLSPANARALADQLARAANIAEGERKAYVEFNAKPHPRAVEMDAPGDVVDGLIYWIWCDDNGQFRYTWSGSTYKGGTPFTPGSGFQSTPAFKTTPAHVALWTKLAYEAAQAAK